MRFVAICEDNGTHRMWAYTLEGIRDSVRMASGQKWTIYQLHEI